MRKAQGAAIVSHTKSLTLKLDGIVEIHHVAAVAYGTPACQQVAVTSLPAECCAGPKQMMYEGTPDLSPLLHHVNGIGGGSRARTR